MIQLNIPTEQSIREIFKEEFEKFIPVKYPEEDRYLSKSETATFIGSSESTVDNLRRAGILNADYLSDGKTRGKPVFLKSEVKEAIEKLKK